MHYKAPLWLPGGHLQTIWPSRISRLHKVPPVRYTRQRLTTPDDDFVDIDWLYASTNPKENPLLVLFHGLEGSSQGHYALSFAHVAKANGWSYAVPHFRGCSGTINQAPRAYHSGDVTEVDWMLSQIRLKHSGPVVAVGISLGGNALMKWAGDLGQAAQHKVHAIASISAPLDLWQSGQHLGTGFNRYVYTAMFLKTMKQKALLKYHQYPKLFDLNKVMSATTLYEFDNEFTAPLHGFKNTEHYWKSASASQVLKHIKIPALVINSQNDPFIPAQSLPVASQLSSNVTVFQPRTGGHVGFPSGHHPLNDVWRQTGDWFRGWVP